MAVRHRAAFRAASVYPSSIPNELLAALPPSEYERIASRLSIVPLKLKAVLYRPGERVTHVYFPGGGFCSVLTVLQDGGMVEVATIGREGMVGASAAFGNNPSQCLTMVLGETDTCYQMKADAFRQEMERGGPFHELVAKFMEASLGAIMQHTACNAIHSIEQRLARWLLMAHDRMESREFPLTQEFVAMMLGAARPTVTVVAGALQTAGIVTYRRGRVTIVDRGKLEAASCECYRTSTALLRGVTERNPER